MQVAQQNQNMTPQQAMAQAVQFFEAGNLSQAEKLCRQIIDVQPGFHHAYFQLGLIASKVGKLQVAANLVEQAIQIEAAAPAYHRALGEIHRRLGNLEKAVMHGQQATMQAPGDADAWYNFGIALADSGKLEEAAHSYRKALENRPDYGLAANNLGTALEKMGDEEGAKEAYAKAVSVNPRHAEAQNNLGALLSASGDLDEARACFTASIEADPAFVHSHYNLSTLKKYTEDDPHYAALEEVANKAESLPVEARMRFWFAIGKAREDVGRYDDAIYAYNQGNRLKRASFQYDESKMKGNIDDIIRHFDSALLKKLGKGGCKDETPVFILGMPRSGTTLIEQILSSHSAVYGAGELRDLGDAITEIRGGESEGSYMGWLPEADKKTLSAIGETYVKKLKTQDSKALRIVDKMPGNFFYAGLIHLILPNAKIIHSMRNPMDTCISNYSRLFNETMPFAYDLEELGRYHRNYKHLMDHWQAVLPEGTVLDVSYEDVVADLEGQARRLIDYCGLEWEEACLDFHKNKRHVKTASIAQVRQPIYKSSVARWERFKDHLDPLRTAIEGKE